MTLTTARPEPAPFAMPARLGIFTLEPLDVEEHAHLLHAWVSHPRSRFWEMQGWTLQHVRRIYRAIDADPHHHAWLGRRDGLPCFLAETYEPAHSELAAHYPVAAGDVGMHVLVAPPDGPPVHGLTSAVMDAVLAFCFASPECARVVVEPDVRNAAVARKNAEAGFVVQRRVRLATKEASLAFCTRGQWRAARAAGGLGTAHAPAHLNPGPMAAAQRRLCAKTLAEFAHERLLAPTLLEGTGAEDGYPGRYALELDDGRVRYTFAARRYPLEHWRLDLPTLARTVGGIPVELDAQQLVLELRERLEIPDALLGTYLEEVAATLAAAAWKVAHPQGRRVAELLDADLAAVEAAMTEGHPGFVVNSARIGFGLADHEAFAPEAGRDVRLTWLAGHREHTHLALGEGVSEAELYDRQLGPDLVRAFAERLRALDLDPAQYVYLPVHPWQWEHKVAVTFAPDVAARRLVLLGPGPDAVRPQQSIRTFLDVERPERHYVKVALSIQNMGFLRGLSPAYMRATPAINDHVAQVVRHDPAFAACGFDVLREVAAIGYTGDAYHAAGPLPGPAGAQRRMVAALWRQSVLSRLRPGERAVTMAALLHRDPDGAHLATAWIERSGLSATAWIQAYLRVYLRPLVHALLAHDLAFMPHGENVIVVLSGDVPVRAVLKDIGEEVAALHERPLPPAVERIRLSATPQVAALSVFTDIFDGFLRHLAGILDADGVLPAWRFWREVATCLAEHAADHPVAHERVDLFTPRFAHSCLNRLQLRNTLQMVDLADPTAGLITAGTLANPVAAWRPRPGVPR